MEKNPYTFDETNPRLVTGVEQPQTVYLMAGGIFAGALYAYNRKFFRRDKNLANFALFAGLGAPASYVYSNFALSSGEMEAGQLNNDKEHGQ